MYKRCSDRHLGFSVYNSEFKFNKSIMVYGILENSIGYTRDHLYALVMLAVIRQDVKEVE